MVLIDLFGGLCLAWCCTNLVPRPPPVFVFFGFSYSSASVYYTERKSKNKKRGRPGNKGSVVLGFPCGLCCSFVYCLTDDHVWQTPHLVCLLSRLHKSAYIIGAYLPEQLGTDSGNQVKGLFSTNLPTLFANRTELQVVTSADVIKFLCSLVPIQRCDNNRAVRWLLPQATFSDVLITTTSNPQDKSQNISCFSSLTLKIPSTHFM